MLNFFSTQRHQHQNKNDALWCTNKTRDFPLSYYGTLTKPPAHLGSGCRRKVHLFHNSKLHHQTIEKLLDKHPDVTSLIQLDWILAY